MIWLAVKLALGGLQKYTSMVYHFVRTKPVHAAALALMLACVWLYMGRQSARDELASFKAAQAVATAKAIAARKAEEARHVERADRTDHETDTLKADYRARTDLHIERMRCPSAPSGTVAATPDQGAGSSDAAGGASLVAVIADDLRICSDNTARLEKAREWALGLNQ